MLLRSPEPSLGLPDCRVVRLGTFGSGLLIVVPVADTAQVDEPVVVTGSDVVNVNGNLATA